MLLASLDAAENQPILVHEYKKDNADLIELSWDGRLILTKGSRWTGCHGRKGRCRVEILAVYEVLTGKQLGEYISKDDGLFSAAGFVQGQSVSAAEISYDSQKRRIVTNGLLWDPVSGTHTDFLFLNAEDVTPVCPLEGDQFLAVIYRKSNPGTSLLAIVDAIGLHELQQPQLPRFSFDFPMGDQSFVSMRANCTAWKAGSSYLVQSAGAERSLHWVSTQSIESSKACRTFPSERVHGYAVSPDGTLVVVMTGVGELPVGAPGYHVFLNMLAARDCSALRRVELLFPEKPTWKTPLLNPKARYRNNVAYSDQFARRITISPDNKMLAITYGVFSDPNGLAFFGLYSLSDGRRLSTVPGDAYKCRDLPRSAAQ